MNTSQMLHKAGRKLSSASKLLRRNTYCSSLKKAQKNKVNLEWVDNHNLGDELAPVIYNWMLNRRQLSTDTNVKKTTHLMTVGSMIGSWNYDAVVWGSGIHMFSNIRKLSNLSRVQKFDIRAVRGPVTRNALLSCGHDCPEIYGDPGVLMPLIYTPDKLEKTYPVSVVLHYHASNEWISKQPYNDKELHYLNIGTDDYKKYIDEMLQSEMVISSSLHGIILAEAYGIPAIFLNTGGYVDEALMKYYDWYFSTGRYTVKVAMTLDEALQMSPMPLPDLSDMQERLIKAFPYDLWTSQIDDDSRREAI